MCVCYNQKFNSCSEPASERRWLSMHEYRYTFGYKTQIVFLYVVCMCNGPTMRFKFVKKKKLRKVSDRNLNFRLTEKNVARRKRALEEYFSRHLFSLVLHFQFTSVIRNNLNHVTETKYESKN